MKIWTFIFIFIFGFSNLHAAEDACSCSLIKNTNARGGGKYPKLECMNLDKGFISVSGYVSTDQENWLKSNSINSDGVRRFELGCKTAAQLKTGVSSLEVENNPAAFEAPSIVSVTVNNSKGTKAVTEEKHGQNCEKVTEEEVLCQGRRYTRVAASTPSSKERINSSNSGTAN